MCIMNEAGRKSICTGVRELRPVREGPEFWKGFEIVAANRLVGRRNTPTGRKKRVMGMLRITIAETLSEQRWTLEGRLVQPWISELKSTWTKTEIARRERKCVVDLRGVTFIDKSGEKALAELSKEGAELIATGIYTCHVVHNIEKKKSNRQR
jgi:hypothetical protein